MTPTSTRLHGRIAVALTAATFLLSTGTALATPLTVQRALTTTAMNEQTTNFENAVSNAVAARFAPSTPVAGDLQAGSAQVWWHNDVRYLDFQNTSAHGVSGSVLLGVDLLATPDLTLGLFGGYSELDTNTELLGTVGNIQSQSISIGGFLGYRLAEGVALDGFLSYSYNDVDLMDAGIRASTESDRLTAGLGVSAAYDLGPVIFSPRAGVSITQDWADAYAGNPSEDFTLFRGVLGAKVGNSHHMGG